MNTCISAPGAVSTNEKSIIVQNAPQETPDLQPHILEQLKALVQLQHQAVSKPPIVTEFVWNTLLQILGLVAAALFGAFTILSWQVGQLANGYASVANGLTLEGVDLANQANCLAGVARPIG